MPETKLDKSSGVEKLDANGSWFGVRKFCLRVCKVLSRFAWHMGLNSAQVKRFRYRTGKLNPNNLFISWPQSELPVPSFKYGTIIVRPDMRLFFASSYFCDLVGLKIQDAAGKSLFDFIAPEDREKTIRLCRASAPTSLQLLLRRIDGIAVPATFQVDQEHNGTAVVVRVSAT
jgi:PAS domain-containing protein